MADNKQSGATGNQPGAGSTARGRTANEASGAMQGASRTAANTAEQMGQRGGETVREVPLVAAANHDEAAFGCPHRFDPGQAARHHVAFGYGVHQCLGQNLVRGEMEAAYRALFERIPGLRLAAPVEELPFKYDGVLFGLHSLPVRW